jgi:hypothetical protein
MLLLPTACGSSATQADETSTNPPIDGATSGSETATGGGVNNVADDASGAQDRGTNSNTAFTSGNDSSAQADSGGRPCGSPAGCQSMDASDRGEGSDAAEDSNAAEGSDAGGSSGGDGGAGEHVGADGGVETGAAVAGCGGAKCTSTQICVHPTLLNTPGLPPPAFCVEVPPSCSKAPTCGCFPFFVCSQQGRAAGACVSIDAQGIECG